MEPLKNNLCQAFCPSKRVSCFQSTGMVGLGPHSVSIIERCFSILSVIEGSTAVFSKCLTNLIPSNIQVGLGEIPTL